MNINEKIYNILINEFEREDVLYELRNIYKYIENNYFRYYEFEYYILYKLKDLLWFNIELQNNKLGLSNLKDLGNKFKIFQQINDNLILNSKDLSQLNNELLFIKNNWDSNWKLVELYSEDNNKWNKNNNIIVYDKLENPRKYNYFKKSKIVDKNNKNIYMNKDVLLCKIDDKLGDSYLNNILYDKIINLQLLCDNCINNDFYLIFKGVN